MIVNIRKFIHEKIENHEDERIQNTNYKALRNIYDFIGDYKLGINGKLTTFSETVNFKKQVGGNAFSIKLKDNKTSVSHISFSFSLFLVFSLSPLVNLWLFLSFRLCSLCLSFSSLFRPSVFHKFSFLPLTRSTYLF